MKYYAQAIYHNFKPEKCYHYFVVLFDEFSSNENRILLHLNYIILSVKRRSVRFLWYQRTGYYFREFFFAYEIHKEGFIFGSRVEL